MFIPRNTTKGWHRHNGSHWLLIAAAASLAVAAVLLVSLTVGPASANHDGIACNDSVPAGWSCAPLVNKPNSGPGVPTPAFGEILFKMADADTMWMSIRALPGAGAIVANEQFCMDDDNQPYSDGSGSGGNKPHDCTGGSKAAVSVTDGSAGIPDASTAEPDSASQYEVRVVSISDDGSVDGLNYAEFNNVAGFTHFVYRVNIGGERTQAFFTLSAAATATPSPTAEPAAEPTPDPTGEPTSVPTGEPTPEPTPTPIPTDAPTPEASEPTPTPEASPTATPLETDEEEFGGGEAPLFVELTEFVSGVEPVSVKLKPIEEIFEIRFRF